MRTREPASIMEPAPRTDPASRPDPASSTDAAVQLAIVEAEYTRLASLLREVYTEISSYREMLFELQVENKALAAADKQRNKGHIRALKERSELCNLLAAAEMLHDSLDRRDIATTMREAIINIVGCEELVIFERRHDSDRLDVVTSFGIEERHLPNLEGRTHLFDEVLRTGKPYFRELFQMRSITSGVTTITAVVPLRANGGISGIIVLFQLMPFKTRLEPNDRELLTLLANQGGRALYAARLHADMQRRSECSS